MAVKTEHLDHSFVPVPAFACHGHFGCRSPGDKKVKIRPLVSGGGQCPPHFPGCLPASPGSQFFLLLKRLFRKKTDEAFSI